MFEIVKGSTAGVGGPTCRCRCTCGGSGGGGTAFAMRRGSLRGLPRTVGERRSGQLAGGFEFYISAFSPSHSGDFPLLMGIEMRTCVNFPPSALIQLLSHPAAPPQHAAHHSECDEYIGFPPRPPPSRAKLPLLSLPSIRLFCASHSPLTHPESR